MYILTTHVLQCLASIANDQSFFGFGLVQQVKVQVRFGSGL